MKKIIATSFVALSLTAVLAHADDSALVREANAALAQKDYATAFSRFSVLAQHGNSAAQFNLGAFYFNGQSVQKDETRAFDWFAQAAAQGYAQALQLLRGAAARGNTNAQAALSRIQQPAAPHTSLPPPADDRTLLAEANAALSQKDYQTAFSKFSILAQRGDATAQFNVGAFYFNGQGIARDERLAYEWLARSAAQGNTRALQIVQNAAAKGNENARKASAAYLVAATAATTSPPQAMAPEKKATVSAPPTDTSSGFSLGMNLGRTGKLTGIFNSFSVGVLAGYSFNKSFGMELAYNALYRNATANNLVSATAPGSTASFDMNAISLTGQYTYPIGDSWLLKGNLGAHTSRFNIKSSTASVSRTGNSAGLVVGLKVQYQASKSIGIRVGFDTYTQSGGITGAVSEAGIGVIFGF